MWRDVYEDFSELTKSEQIALFEAMKQDLFPEEPDKITKLLKSIRESRFASGLGCLHTLPKIAERLNIHISTAFYWRHKILNALGSLGFNQLQGIVESDETFFRES